MKRQFLIQTCIAVLFLAGPWLAGSALAGWDIETVDSTGDVGTYTSIALDANGYPHISYHDEDNGNLKYACFNGTTCTLLAPAGRRTSSCSTRAAIICVS